MTTVAFIAAMPEEIKPLLRRVSAERELLAGFPLYRFTVRDHACCLIESGMGPERAAAAATVLLKNVRPKFLVSCGFCGAATAGPTTGDLVVAEKVVSCREKTFSSRDGLSAELSDSLFALLVAHKACDSASVFRGTFFTTAEITAKKDMIELFPAGPPYPVLEMETAAVAEVAAQERIAMAAIRAVSDDAGEELGFSLSEFTDSEMRIRPVRVLFTIMRKPWIVPQLIRLSKNIKVAGERLAWAVGTVAGSGGKFGPEE